MNIWTYDIFIIHSSLENMGCNHILATVNSTTVNMKVQVPLQDFDFNYFGYIPISGNGGSYSSCIFNFLQNLQTVFHYWCTIFHYYRKCKRFKIIQQPSQLLLSFDLFFFFNSHLYRCKVICHCSFYLHFSNN